VTLHFADGEVGAVVGGVEKAPPRDISETKPEPRKRREGEQGRQQDLFS
jgi:hypothetical protein